MDTLLYTVLVAVGIAFLLGVLLGLFKKVFHVNTDPKVQAVRDVLSGGNCGGCGLAGCDSFAKAVVAGEVETNGCVAGGGSCATQISKILGVDGGEVKPKAAFIFCQGSKDCAQDKGIYNGVKSCKAASVIINGTKKCSFGCAGFGDCVEACTFGALRIVPYGLPVVNYEKCVGCGKCVVACPKKLIKVMEKETKGAVALCSSFSDNKPQIKKDCSKGCFKCGICAKKCPSQCINVSSGIPVIDYTKCTSCGECVNACPDKVLTLIQDIVK